MFLCTQRIPFESLAVEWESRRSEKPPKRLSRSCIPRVTQATATRATDEERGHVHDRRNMYLHPAELNCKWQRQAECK